MSSACNSNLFARSPRAEASDVYHAFGNIKLRFRQSFIYKVSNYILFLTRQTSYPSHKTLGLDVMRLASDLSRSQAPLVLDKRMDRHQAFRSRPNNELIVEASMRALLILKTGISTWSMGTCIRKWKLMNCVTFLSSPFIEWSLQIQAMRR
ncbi:hypothetical protein NL676_022845 [Syzygium grande]|nr:hypothetical protein NL676_022845 [Syzygium grande]